ncbi:MAG: type VI secretion system contractile sheath large subunit, partial [Pseudomonadota bacterium]|nr:type VI secretion system contractile sheath large subunit [Pseudomonadota bacterium]
MLNDSAGMAVMSENPSPTLSSDEIPLADIYSFLSENDDVEAFRHWVELSSPADTSRLEPCRWLAQQVAYIDELISEQIDAVLHNKRFQALEASWRGLWFLIDAVVNPENTKIRLLDVSWKDLARDMERAPDFDQSGLFHLIYNEEFGTPGGEPFSVLLGDYYVAHRPYEDHRIDDVFTLQGISRAAAAAFCPFVCSAAPQLFGLDDFDNLGLHINVDEIFRSHDYVRWRSMREHDDSRFLALTLPQVLMREPYQDNRRSRRGLRFNESVAGKDNRKYLWGNACFALGTVLIREFSEVGWFSHIRGVPRDHYGGGLVTQFPTPAYRTDSSRA